MKSNTSHIYARENYRLIFIIYLIMAVFILITPFLWFGFDMTMVFAWLLLWILGAVISNILFAIAFIRNDIKYFRAATSVIGIHNVIIILLLICYECGFHPEGARIYGSEYIVLRWLLFSFIFWLLHVVFMNVIQGINRQGTYLKLGYQMESKASHIYASENYRLICILYFVMAVFILSTAILWFGFHSIREFAWLLLWILGAVTSNIIYAIAFIRNDIQYFRAATSVIGIQNMINILLVVFDKLGISPNETKSYGIELAYVFGIWILFCFIFWLMHVLIMNNIQESNRQGR